MAILAVQLPSVTGAAVSKAAANAGGDSFPNTGQEFVEITNNNATDPRTVTFDSPGTCNFGVSANAAHDAPSTIAAQTSKIIGPFPTPRFNDANNRVQMSYSDAGADLQIAVFRQA